MVPHGARRSWCLEAVLPLPGLCPQCTICRVHKDAFLSKLEATKHRRVGLLGKLDSLPCRRQDCGLSPELPGELRALVRSWAPASWGPRALGNAFGGVSAGSHRAVPTPLLSEPWSLHCQVPRGQLLPEPCPACHALTQLPPGLLFLEWICPCCRPALMCLGRGRPWVLECVKLISQSDAFLSKQPLHSRGTEV